jgi:hypothetical protein
MPAYRPVEAMREGSWLEMYKYEQIGPGDCALVLCFAISVNLPSQSNLTSVTSTLAVPIVAI